MALAIEGWLGQGVDSHSFFWFDSDRASAGVHEAGCCTLTRNRVPDSPGTERGWEVGEAIAQVVVIRWSLGWPLGPRAMMGRADPASFDIVISWSSMRSTIAWKIVDTRKVGPKMATLLRHLRGGSGLPCRQRAMLFMIKDLITQKGHAGVPLARNYSRKSLAKIHHYRRSFYFMTIIFYRNHIIIILFAKSCSRARNFSGYSLRIPSLWNVTSRGNSSRSISKTGNH